MHTGNCSIYEYEPNSFQCGGVICQIYSNIFLIFSHRNRNNGFEFDALISFFVSKILNLVLVGDQWSISRAKIDIFPFTWHLIQPLIIPSLWTLINRLCLPSCLPFTWLCYCTFIVALNLIKVGMSLKSVSYRFVQLLRAKTKAKQYKTWIGTTRKCVLFNETIHRGACLIPGKQMKIMNLMRIQLEIWQSFKCIQPINFWMDGNQSKTTKTN